MAVKVFGYAIVSRDGMIADANGRMTETLIIEADQIFYEASLARARLVVHGRNSAEPGAETASRPRLIATTRIAALAPGPNLLATLWNPNGLPFAEALLQLGIDDGIVAVVGGTNVFDLFFTVGYDAASNASSLSPRRPRNVATPSEEAAGRCSTVPCRCERHRHASRVRDARGAGMQCGRTGTGQLVEVAMQEAVLNLTRVKYTGTLATGKPLGRSGNRSATGGYSDLIRCAPSGSNEAGPNDGVYLIVPPDNPEMFHAAMDAIGRPELKEDERFKTAAARSKNGAALTEIIEGWTRTRDKREVMQEFAGRGIPCGAVLDTAEVLADPHLRERGTIRELDHPTRGRFSAILSPVRLSDSPIQPSRAPMLGEHSDDILALDGYTLSYWGSPRAVP